MGRLALLVAAVGIVGLGCGPTTPSDEDQQKLAKEFSSENVAKEYEKKGMFKEAEELRKNSQEGQ